MALKSVYLPEPKAASSIISIEDEEHRHLVVTRAERGELLEVFDGKGNVWSVEVLELGKRKTLAKIVSQRQVPRPALELILGQAMIRTAAFEVAVEKAVEVGVTRIVPFVASRSNASHGRADRWQRIVIEAAKQSKRYWLPAIESPVRFDQVLAVSAASRILFAESDGASLKSALSGSPVLYLVGPEGGWTAEEVTNASAAGFQAVTLGSGILRSETAAIVGASVIRYELGDI